MKKDLPEETYRSGFISNLDGPLLMDIQNVPYVITAVGEKTGGYDAVINLKKPGILMFLQFKIPDNMASVKSKQISNSLGEDVSCIDYCISIKAKDEFRQHRNLLYTELAFMPCLSYYASPTFNTCYEYGIERMKRSICNKSVYFSPVEIGAIPAVSSCKIGYPTTTGDAVLYTHANRSITHAWKVHAYTFDDVVSAAYEKLDESRNSLHQNIDDVYEHVIYGILGSDHALAIREEGLPQRLPDDQLKYFLARQSKYTKGDKNGRHYDIKIKILMSVAELMDATLFIMHPTDKVY